MGVERSLTPTITTTGKDTETLAQVLTDSLLHIAKVKNLLKLSGRYSD